jgi:pimeloyl-ACP methyl ester carboxylesterase
VRADGPAIGHVLFCHGNGGNISDRAPHAALLATAGLDVLLFDYRGYGRSPGRPDEESTYVDARAARAALLSCDGVDPARVLYLGESLGAAVALELALAHPPAGLILQSPFISVRDIARFHYPYVPRALVPDAYPSLDRIPHLRTPLLVIHGARDPVVPLMHGEELFRAAQEPKRLEVFPDAGHNDLGGERWAALISNWAAGALRRE